MLDPRTRIALIELLPKLNVGGYNLIRHKSQVLLKVKLHEGPLQTQRITADESELIGIGEAGSTWWLINRVIAPRFFRVNKVVPSRDFCDFTKDSYLAQKKEFLNFHTKRIRCQIRKVNKSVKDVVKTTRTDTYKTSIKYDIISVCKRFKLDPTEFMNTMLNEIVVESVMKQ